MPALLAVRDLACTPPGASAPAFRGLAFEAQAAEIVTLTGPRGSGKSAALRVFAGLLREYEGAVDFRGRELKEWGRDFFLDIGAALEAPLLHRSLTALENLEYVAGLYPSASPDGRPREAASLLLERLGLAAAAKRPAGSLSAGDRRKLALARAYRHRPALLLLDEPFQDLDPEGIAQVTSLLETHRKDGGLAVLAFEAAPAGTSAFRAVPLSAPASAAPGYGAAR